MRAEVKTEDTVFHDTDRPRLTNNLSEIHDQVYAKITVMLNRSISDSNRNCSISLVVCTT